MVDLAQTAAIRWWETVGVGVDGGVGGAIAHQAFVAGWDAREGAVGHRTRDIDPGRGQDAPGPIAIIAQVLRDNRSRPAPETARKIIDALDVLTGSAATMQPMGCICPPTSEQTCRRSDCARRGFHGGV